MSSSSNTIISQSSSLCVDRKEAPGVRGYNNINNNNITAFFAGRQAERRAATASGSISGTRSWEKSKRTMLRRPPAVVLLCFALLFALVASTLDAGSDYMPARDAYPQIISHRGASGYIPEHSLAAYRAAMDLLTDYIEPDLCLSKDGIFVALHDLLLDDTTNVMQIPAFASKQTTKVVEGKNMTGFFVSDFTYEELQQLSLIQRLSDRSPLFNDLLKIPTLQQIMQLSWSHFNSGGIGSSGTTVGIYVELKHPSFFHSLGWAMEDMLLEQLAQGGFLTTGAAVPSDLRQVVPVVVQCFDALSLKYIKTKSTLPLIQLMENPSSEDEKNAFLSQQQLEDMATYASGFGPDKTYLGQLTLADAQEKVKAAHELNLFIHPYTFRAEKQYVLPQFRGDFAAEQTYFYCCLHMDGLFTEFADRTRQVLGSLSLTQDACTSFCAAYL